MLNADSMAGRIMNYIDAVAAPNQSSTANLHAYRYSIMRAMCQGIIEEIQLNMEINACQDHPVWGQGIEVVK